MSGPPPDLPAGRLPRARGDRDVDVPTAIIGELRAVCLGLPEAVEEAAWAGTRWRIGTRTFAHVLMVVAGWPPAYARAIGSDGPQCVLTFRSSGPELDAVTGVGHPFFRPAWGTTWKYHVIGMTIDTDVDWEEVAELVAESYCLLAPRRLAARVERPA